MDFRIGIDVMTTETACLSSIWPTDGAVRAYYAEHGRERAYRPIAPADGAVYDAMIEIDLAAVEPMIAMPFHPSKAHTIRELNENAADILREAELDAERQFGGKVKLRLTDKISGGSGGGGSGGNANVVPAKAVGATLAYGKLPGANLALGNLLSSGSGGSTGNLLSGGSGGGGGRGSGAWIQADQGIIAGCAGGMYDNIREAAAILGGASVGDGYFSLSVYPPSTPVSLQLMQSGALQALAEAGALIKPCFCGPCFGAGDVPANNGLSVRHTTRNFPNREGSSPGDGQLAAVALMDARSIAATARNFGRITPADELDYDAPSEPAPPYSAGIYAKRVYNGVGRPDAGAELRFGPNIADWPKIDAMGESLMLRIASVLDDPVTTTDELIPSGETASYRSNPQKLAGFALARRDPQYVPRARAIREIEERRGRGDVAAELAEAIGALRANAKLAPAKAADASLAYGKLPAGNLLSAGSEGNASLTPGDSLSAGSEGNANLAYGDLLSIGSNANLPPAKSADDKLAYGKLPDANLANARLALGNLLSSEAGGDTSVVANMQVASVIFARKPGDGSAREQAASCQRVLGGGANICYEYATKRYRSNLINWGMMPFTIGGGAAPSGAAPDNAASAGAASGEAAPDSASAGALSSETAFSGMPGDWIYVPSARSRLAAGESVFPAKLISGGSVADIELRAEGLTPDERDIILAGCLMNYYAAKAGGA
jgi:aconitate hydratase